MFIVCLKNKRDRKMNSLSLALIFSTLVTLALCKPPIVIEPVNPKDPAALPVKFSKSALVIGAGLSGLSAALELSERGYAVTMKEKEHLGGKLFCKPVQVFTNETFYVEHGFHAWFHAYYQFKDIRNRLGINDNFKVWEKVNYYFQNYKPEVIYSKGPYPLNLIGILLRSPNLHFTDAIKSTLMMPDLIFYDFDRMNSEYDNITFREWATEKKVAQDFYDIILQPALSVTLNEREVFSAAEMLAFLQIYFLSQSDSDEREVAKYNYYQSVLKPWQDRLIQNGVKFEFNKTVQSLKVNADTLEVYGSIDTDADDPTKYDYVVLTAEIGATQLIFNQTIKNYQTSPQVYKTLVNCYNNGIGKMKIAPSYKVIRIWFDRQLSADTPEIIETPDFGPVNLIAQYSMLEEEFINWANRTGGSVIEFHAYTWDKNFNANATDDQVWGLIAPTVKRILPEIFDRNFQILAYHVNSYQNFASFQKGLYASRPTTSFLADQGLKNIYLAGDWIKTGYPSALMERAVSTGREAANQILLKDHVRQASLTVTNLHGPGI